MYNIPDQNNSAGPGSGNNFGAGFQPPRQDGNRPVGKVSQPQFSGYPQPTGVVQPVQGQGLSFPPAKKRSLLDWKLILLIVSVLVIVVGLSAFIAFRFFSGSTSVENSLADGQDQVLQAELEPVSVVPSRQVTTVSAGSELSVRLTETGDFTLCSQAELSRDGMTPDSCYLMFAKNSGSAEPCVFITEERGVVSRDSCYGEIAVITGDSILCDEVKSVPDRDLCLFDIAQKTLSSMTCPMISAQDGEISKDSCYLRLALRLSNPAFCDAIDKIGYGNSKDYCFFRLAMQTSNLTYCEKIPAITGESSKDSCFYYLSLQYKDGSICEKISADTGDISKQSCITYINQQTAVTTAVQPAPTP